MVKVYLDVKFGVVVTCLCHYDVSTGTFKVHLKHDFQMWWQGAKTPNAYLVVSLFFAGL